MSAVLKRGAIALVVVAIVSTAIAACGSSGSDVSSGANDVDVAFVNQMLPHHELAVEMAKIAEERAGHPEIGKLAKNIASTQAKEIAQMRSIQDDISGDDASMSDDADTLGISMEEMGMSMDVGALSDAKPFDQAFIQMMVPHHEGALTMANAELAGGSDPELLSLAQSIVDSQTPQIDQMKSWLSDWYPGTTVAPVATTG